MQIIQLQPVMKMDVPGTVQIGAKRNQRIFICNLCQPLQMSPDLVLR